MIRASHLVASLLLAAGLATGVAQAQSGPPPKKPSSGETTSTKPSTKPSPGKAKGPASSEPEDQELGAKQKHYKEIKMGRIKEFKPIWNNVAEIQGTITGWEIQLDGVRVSLKSAAGVAQDQPLRTAFEDVKATAGDKLRVTLEQGAIPRVSGDDLPANVVTFVDAVNLGVTSCVGIVQSVKDLPQQVESLLQAAQAMPGRLTPTLLADNGLDANDLQRQAMVIQHNVEAIVETRDRVAGVVNAANRIVSFARDLGPVRKPTPQ